MTTTPIAPEPAASATRAVRFPDFAVRLKAHLRALRARLSRRETIVDLVVQAHASRDPKHVAVGLIRQAADWIPAPVWGVVVRDVDGELRLLASHGLTSDMEASVWTAAHAVLQRRREFVSADLAHDAGTVPGAALDAAPGVSGSVGPSGSGSVGASGSVVALPLQLQDQLIGALVGFDPQPSSAAPALGTVEPLLRSALGVVTVALDSALRLERAEALSVTDDLTRLYNARYLNYALRRESKLSGRNDRPVSLVFLDLDGFKNVNDKHGHLAGSKALVEVGAVLKACARETDIVARFGGDEFAVILPDTGSPGAVKLAERIRTVLKTHTFLAGDGLSVQLTASIGIATLPDVATSAEDLLKVADAAMYRVKAAGKDGIRVGQE